MEGPNPLSFSVTVSSPSGATWIRAKQSKCTHFGELQYGFGLPLGNPAGASVPDDGYDDFYDDGGMTHYAGLEYSYVKSGMGFRTSMMYGINNGEFLLSVGPAIRLTKTSAASSSPSKTVVT